jgi:hypothetical protein
VAVEREGRLVVVPLESDQTYDVILGAVAALACRRTGRTSGAGP